MLNESAASVHKNLTMRLSSFERSQQPLPPFTGQINRAFTARPCLPRPPSRGSQKRGKRWLTLNKTNVISQSWHQVAQVHTLDDEADAAVPTPPPQALFVSVAQVAGKGKT